MNPPNHCHRAALCPTRRRTLSRLALTRLYYMLGQDPRTIAASEFLETLLHLPVFQTHEGDDDDPPARPHQIGRRLQQAVEFIELSVDHQTKSHEGSRSR